MYNEIARAEDPDYELKQMCRGMLYNSGIPIGESKSMADFAGRIAKCKHCGNEFIRNEGDETRNVCYEQKCKDIEDIETMDKTEEYIGEKRICKFCKKPFRLRNPQAKRRYHCYEQKCEAQNKAENNANNLAQARKKWREKRRDTEIQKRVCIHCGEEFQAKEHSTARRHCYKPECIDYHKAWLKLPMDKRKDKMSIQKEPDILVNQPVKIAEKPEVTLEQFGHPAMAVHFQRLLEIHRAKDHDYAGNNRPLSNFRRAEEFGVEAWRGVLIRMSDKWSRLVSLSKLDAQVTGETINDTLDDIALYAMILRILKKEADNAENI